MTNDIRAALERLLQHIDDPTRTPFTRNDAIAAARAALAEPVGDDDSLIDRWIESRPDWPNDWPAVTQSQLTALIGEALEHWGRPATQPAPEPGEQHVSQPYKLPESGEGPTDEELLAMRSWSSHGHTFDSDLVDFARAVLTRWGHPAAPPAPEAGEGHWSEGICGDGAAILRDGVMVPIEEVVQALNRIPAAPPVAEEVAELVEWLKGGAPLSFSNSGLTYRQRLDRAATLLQQHAAPAPVPVAVAVAERPWEREGWCDEQGHCWFFSPRFNTWSWERPPVALTRGVGRFLSLPAHAIPLPRAGEGEV